MPVNPINMITDFVLRRRSGDICKVRGYFGFEIPGEEGQVVEYAQAKVRLERYRRPSHRARHMDDRRQS
jgi:hypothetical protein